MKKYSLIFFIIICFFSVSAQDFSLFEKKIFISGKDTMPYRILFPENYNPGTKYPLIIFLHGSGERGNDNEKQLVHGATLFLKENIREKYPAIIVFPQCKAGGYWSNVKKDTLPDGKQLHTFFNGGKPTADMQLLQKLLFQLKRSLPVVRKRMYVGGLSMGGMGTFELVMRNPKLFAAAFPICGGANPAIVKKLRKTNWWIFHGAKDKVVDCGFSIKMAEVLQKQKTPVKITIYPEADHNSWDSAFAEKDLLEWLFDQTR